jgi:hypothetical protein
MRYLLISFICLAGFALNAQTIDPALQTKFLPKELKGLYIGMSKETLAEIHPSAVVPENSVLGYPEESFKAGDIKAITYQTESDSGTVYEFIIEYRSTAKAIAIAKQLFKKPNDVSKNFPLAWKIPLKDGLTLKCWIFRSKICIADARQF